MKEKDELLNLEKFNLLEDIYYSKEYVSLYLKKDEAIFEFKYQENEHIFYNIAIKRPIKKIGNVDINDGYFDLETAYGYGGFYTNSENIKFISRAIKKYVKKCIDEKIIAEFIRFHPFNDFPEKYSDFFDISIYDRDIVLVDLNLSKDERWNSYSSNVRNILRKCEKELTFTKSSNIDMFIELYKKTMNRNNAKDFYYFTKNYFKKLLSNKNVELYEVQKDSRVISSAIFMFGSNFCHYHLSANDYEMKKYNGNYFLLDRMFDVAKRRGKKYFILGGGRSNLKDDSLFKFKQKFSKLTRPFYIAGKIYNKDIYKKYIHIWEEQSQKKDIKYFLKYRLEVK